MLLLACVAVMVALLWWWRQRGAKFRAMVDKFPGPKAYPLIGNALDLGTTTNDLHVNLDRLCAEYGSEPFRLWMGPTHVYIVLIDPRDVEIILSSNKLLDKGYLYDYFHSWLGTGLLTSTATKWRRRRKIITPTFHFKILEDFIDVFNANGEILVEKLKKEVDGPGFDVHDYVTLYALDIICETAMGVKMNTQNDSDSDYVNAIRNMGEVIMKRSFKPWLAAPLLFNLTKYKKLEDDSLQVLHGMTNSVIAQRRAEMRAKSVEVAADADDGVKRRLAFLDMLIESTHEGSLLTDEDIREEVDTFMFEGHDTTSSGISFALWLMAWNPDVQEKVWKELEETFPDADEPVSFRGLQDLKYMERVIKEAQRIYPSVPMFMRELTEDVTLSGGKVAPKGSTVLIDTFTLQRNPNVFPDPGKFDPDHFLPDNVQGRNPYAFVPFSAGPRNCIGQKFAMLELKSAIAHVVRNFTLLPGTEKPDLQLANAMILVSNTGIKIKLVSRKR